MRPTVQVALLMALGLTIGGCATPTTQSVAIEAGLTEAEVRYQEELKLHRVIDYQNRIERIGVRLLKAALPFCDGDTTGYTGLKVDNISHWAWNRRLAKDSLKLDEALKVTDVIPGSPADRAGVEVGDMLLAVNGHMTIGGSGAVQDYLQLVQRVGIQQAEFRLLRDKQRLNVKLTPELVCNYSIQVVMNNAINAYADGRNVGITSGLIRFAENDAEIGMVLAHEIAHNSMEHLEAQRTNASIASVLDVFISAYGVSTGAKGPFASLGEHAFSKAFEQEADYVGLYILARADIPLDGLSGFWRRMAAETPNANKDTIYRSHPITAQRTLAIDLATEEIKQKVEQGEKLLPNAK